MALSKDTALLPLPWAYPSTQPQQSQPQWWRWNVRHFVGAMVRVLRVSTAFFLLLGCVFPRTSAIRRRSSSPQMRQAVEDTPAGRAAVGNKRWTLRQLAISAKNGSVRRLRLDRTSIVSSGEERGSPDIGECILLFGAFCSGNMGDVIQPMAMENLLASVAPDQCFWFAHPREEEGYGQCTGKGALLTNGVSDDKSRFIQVTPDDAEKVNRFKALIIGGGGIFASRHTPLHVSAFARGLTLPIIVLGAGASRHRAKIYATLAERAVFVSGRDAISTSVLAGVLRDSKDPKVQPNDVALVHDPVLSDTTLTDTEGTCWKQSEGEYDQPLCFVLPASNTQASIEMHQHLVAHVVRPGDVFVNVLPTHQEDILRRNNYPGDVVQVFGSAEFTQRLCSCRAIVSARFHGVILGLHMGVPTFGASPTPRGSLLTGLVIDTMRLPEQLFVVNGKLSRETVDQEVEVVRQMYSSHGRRASIYARLSALHDDFEVHARHVLFGIIGVPQYKQPPKLQPEQSREQVERERREEKLLQSEDFFSEAGIAQFLPDLSERGGPAALGRYPVSSSPPSVGGSESAAAALASAAVAAGAAEDPSPVRDAKTDTRIKEGRLTTEREKEQAEATRAKLQREAAAASISQGSVGRAQRADTNTITLLTSPTASVVERVIPATSAMATENETVATAADSQEDITKNTPLANVLLANKEVFSRSTGEEKAVSATGAEPQPPLQKTSSAASHGSKASAGENELSIAEALISNRSAFERTTKKNGGNSAERMNAGGHPHRGSDRAEWGATASEASMPGAASESGDNRRIPAAERASINDAIETTWIKDDCVVAVLLVTAVVGLALLPSGGAPRRVAASHDNLVAKEGGSGSEGDVTPHAQRDGDSGTCSDSEGSMTSRRPSPALLTHSAGAPARVATTSSKMIFMLNFAMWVSLSMGFGGYGKAYLLDTADPVGLLVLQGATGVVVLCLCGHFGVVDLHPTKGPTPAAAPQAGSAASLHTAQTLLINLTLLMSGVAASNAMEAMEPVAAAAFSYFLLGKNVRPARMAALATIVVGIVLLTFKRNSSGGESGGGSSDYTIFSAVLAVGTVCFNALRNVVIKKGNPTPPHQTLLACSSAATVVGVGLMLLRPGLLMVDDFLAGGGSSAKPEHRVVHSGWVRMEGVNASLCFVGYNLASFNLLVRLSPVDHAVGNVCKRMLVIAGGLLFLGEVMTASQLGGTVVALFGVLAYNVAGTVSLPSAMELPVCLTRVRGCRIT